MILGISPVSVTPASTALAAKVSTSIGINFATERITKKLPASPAHLPRLSFKAHPWPTVCRSAKSWDLKVFCFFACLISEGIEVRDLAATCHGVKYADSRVLGCWLSLLPPPLLLDWPHTNCIHLGHGCELGVGYGQEHTQYDINLLMRLTWH